MNDGGEFFCDCERPREWPFGTGGAEDVLYYVITLQSCLDIFVLSVDLAEQLLQRQRYNNSS